MSDRRISMLEQRIERLERALQLQFALSRSTAPSVDTGAVQLNQGQIDPLSLQDNIPTLLNYGFSSSLPVGGDKAMIFIGGNRSQGVAVATGHQAHRYKGLTEGEVVMHDMWGNSIHMTAAGIVITAPSTVLVNAPALATSGNVVVGTGASGTFTDSAGSVVTVADGIIINIS
jgi:phage gp45-like